jgi:hypothetical protein
VRNRLEIKGMVTSEADCARNCIANDACIGFESVDSRNCKLSIFIKFFHLFLHCNK